MENLKIIQGDCRTALAALPERSMQCCVTSPPYWGLRDYGHPDQIGQEPTPDLFVKTMVTVFSEVWRVLKDDGTLWLNLGDSRVASGCGGNPPGSAHKMQANNNASCGLKPRNRKANIPPGLKPKDLAGIPWRVAFALQAAGWYLRQDIIWAKPNPMPESVRDRCTASHEYIFLLTKRAKYFYDADAIKEPCTNGVGPRPDLNGSTITGSPHGRHILGGAIPEKQRRTDKQRGHSRRHNGFNDRWDAMERGDQCIGLRNKRDVWTVAPANYKGAHFATFPAKLITPCILAGSRVGDTVLDPFGGSGTVGEVAIELERKAVLIELNPKYIEMIEQRTNITPGLSL